MLGSLAIWRSPTLVLVLTFGFSLKNLSTALKPACSQVGQSMISSWKLSKSTPAKPS